MKINPQIRWIHVWHPLKISNPKHTEAGKHLVPLHLCPANKIKPSKESKRKNKPAWRQQSSTNHFPALFSNTVYSSAVSERSGGERDPLLLFFQTGSAPAAAQREGEKNNSSDVILGTWLKRCLPADETLNCQRVRSGVDTRCCSRSSSFAMISAPWASSVYLQSRRDQHRILLEHRSPF